MKKNILKTALTIIIVSIWSEPSLFSQTVTAPAAQILQPLEIQTNAANPPNPAAPQQPVTPTTTLTTPNQAPNPSTNGANQSGPLNPPVNQNNTVTSLPTKYSEPQYDCKMYINYSLPSQESIIQSEILDTKQIETNKKRISFLQEKLKKNRDNYVLISRLGREYYDQKLYLEASEHLWSNLSSLKIKDLLLLAESYEKLNLLTDLKKIANIIIGKDEKSAAGYLYLAKSLSTLKVDELKERKKNLLKAIELDKTNKQAILLLSQIFRQEKNWYDERNILTDAIKHIKNDRDLMTQLCESLSLDSVHDESEKQCRENIRLFPDEIKNYVYLGITLREIYKTKESDELFQTAVEKFPNAEFSRACLAESKYKKNDFLGAFSDFKFIYDQKIYTDRIVMGYAKSAFQIKKFNEALEAFKYICNKDRRNSVEFRRSMLELSQSTHKKEWLEYEKELNSCVNR